jgi:uncharacterized DUF497 family protein
MLRFYIWDEAKRLSNLAKHGVDFRSVEGFDWDFASFIEDRSMRYGDIGRYRPVPLATASMHWFGPKRRMSAYA